MDANRKRNLRAAYKERKSEAGVFCVTCVETGDIYLAAAKDIPAALNRARFQLDAGLHPNKSLQDAWSRLGEDAFAFDVVQRLEPAEGEDDPSGELEELLELCLAEQPASKRLVASRVVR